jgi:hypothetical protein
MNKWEVPNKPFLTVQSYFDKEKWKLQNFNFQTDEIYQMHKTSKVVTSEIASVKKLKVRKSSIKLTLWKIFVSFSLFQQLDGIYPSSDQMYA